MLRSPPPASGSNASHRKRNVLMVWENASFSEVVGMLENARVAAEGLEQAQQTSQKPKGDANPKQLFFGTLES